MSNPHVSVTLRGAEIKKSVHDLQNSVPLIRMLNTKINNNIMDSSDTYLIICSNVRQDNQVFNLCRVISDFGGKFKFELCFLSEKF